MGTMERFHGIGCCTESFADPLQVHTLLATGCFFPSSSSPLPDDDDDNDDERYQHHQEHEEEQQQADDEEDDAAHETDAGMWEQEK